MMKIEKITTSPEVVETPAPRWAPIVVVLRLIVEWGVGMGRQDPSYGVVVHTSLRVQALLGGSNSPTSRCLEAVDWIICVCEFTKDANPCASGGGGLYRVRQVPSQPTLQGV